MARLAETVIPDSGVPLALEASTERSDVLSGPDFVVLGFTDRTVKSRGIGCEIAGKCGIRVRRHSNEWTS